LIDRQKLIGWGLVIASSVFIAYFLRTRLLAPGPAVAKKEWLELIGSIGIFMLGTANVRLAAIRARKRDDLPK
jgi:uncharacterized membrane protein